MSSTNDIPTGNHWKGIDSAIISHCQNEAEAFTPEYVVGKEDFEAFLEAYLPGENMKPERDAIKNKYQCRIRFLGDYGACLRAVIRDSTFTCNTRNLFDVFAPVSYTMSYGYPSKALALHGTDLLPMFMNETQVVKFLVASGQKQLVAETYARRLVNKVTEPFLRYYASFATSGEPNSMLEEGGVAWPVTNGERNKLRQVLQAGVNGFRLITDGQNTRNACDFWEDIARRLVNKQGGTGRGEHLAEGDEL